MKKSVTVIVRIILKLTSKTQGRRIFFLASLHAKLKHIDDPDIDKELLEPFNNKFTLVDNLSALKLPIYAAAFVWEDLSDTKTSLVERAEEIVKSTPSWMRYSNRDEMIKDVTLILEYQ